MAFVVEEIGRSGGIGESGEVKRSYFAQGYADEAAAAAAVLTYLETNIANPPNIGGLVVRTIDPQEVPDVAGSWRCGVTWGPYEKREPTPVGGNDFSFEFELENVHVNTSLQTTAYNIPASGRPALNVGKAIGFNPKDKTVAGVDIEEPVYGWAETHYFNLADLTPSYKQAISAIVGRVNSATFRGYPAGEVKCMAPSGQQRGADDFGITFRFKQRKNFSGTIEGVAVTKKGWEYLEVIYDREAGVSTIIPKPWGIYVHQVIETVSFAGLNIGS